MKKTITGKSVPRESDTIELKSSFETETVVSLSAFANTRGGTVYLGIDDRGNVIGCTIGKETGPQWINQIKMATSPTLVPDVEIKKLQGKTVVAFSIPGSPERVDEWEYPPDGLREIVVNAIVHRDYSSASDTIVKIFDDHISIYNPGKLPQGITIRNLLSGQYVSTPRNHQIADIFKEAGIIEKYGSGIRRIRESFKKASNREPLFEEIGEGFMVTHYAEGPRFCRGMNAPSASGCRTSSLRLREPKEIFGAADSCRRGSTVFASTPPKTPQKGAVVSGPGAAIINFLNTDPSATRTQIAKGLGYSSETVKEYLAKLKSEGALKRVGGRKAGEWVVKEQ